MSALLRYVEDRRDIERTRLSEQQDYPDQETHVADAGGDERLLRRFHRGAPLEPEAYQQVGSQTDQLPGDVQEQQIIG